MGNCKIYWDDLSYQILNDGSNFSIQNIPGTTTIKWDTTKQHIVNNSSNYSYNIYTNPMNSRKYYYEGTHIADGGTCLFLKRRIYFNNTNNLSGTIINKSNYYSLCGYSHNSSIDNGGGENPFLSSSTGWLLFNVVNRGYGEIGLGTVVGMVWVQSDIPPAVRLNTTFGNPDLLRIIDNGIIYDYGITNTNSVQVISSQGVNKIVIEGNQFEINDVNSAFKDCTERCPPDTITCDCDTQTRCCYKQVEKGYQLVKTIIL